MKISLNIRAIYVAITRKGPAAKHSFDGCLLDDSPKAKYGATGPPGTITVYDDNYDGDDAVARKTLLDNDASARRHEPTFKQKFGLAMWKWRKRMREKLHGHWQTPITLKSLRGMKRRGTRPRSFSVL